MGSFPSFDQLNWQQRQTAFAYSKDNKPWIGWDTETCEGQIGLAARDVQPWYQMDKQEQNCVQDYYESKNTLPQDWHEWDLNGVEAGKIIQKMFHPKFHGVWWNMKFDVECILKHLPENKIKKLLACMEVEYKGFKLHYIPGKKFTIQRGKHQAHHFDIASFYMTGLDYAAEMFLERSKKDLPFSRKELGSDWSIWAEHKERIIRYCYQDSELTRQLAKYWVDWADNFGVDASYPISPANVAGKHALKQNYPTYSEAFHRTVGKRAWKSYYGGRFEARKKGTFDQLYNYDIKSAYPSEMVEMPSTDQLTWVKKDNNECLDFDLGFVKGDFRVSDQADWAPIMSRQSDGLVFAPCGTHRNKWITLSEYRRCLEHEYTECQMETSIVANDDGSRPFDWIRDIYAKRVELKKNDDPRELILKIIINSVYGKTLQKNPVESPVQVEKYQGHAGNKQTIMIEGEPHVVERKEYDIGPLFNPVYGSITTARTRCQCWDMMQKYDTVMVMTDGILTTEKAESSDLGTELGDWELDAKGRGLIIGNGLYQLEDKRPKRRGFVLPDEFDTWFTAFENADHSQEALRIVQRRPIHPGEALTQKTWDLSEVGAFRDVPKNIHLNNDRKRDFPDVTVGEMLEDNFEGDLICH